MDIIELSLAPVKLIRPTRIIDGRGWFAETFRADLLARAGITETFVQENHSFSARAGTVRGLHYQDAPHAQSKLVAVLHGAIFDVAVDLRRASPSFGQHIAVELSAEDGAQLFVPAGFAHGFCTLVEDSTVVYKVSAYYSKEHDRSLRWNDPVLGIRWPVDEAIAVLSEKDRTARGLHAVNPQ